jgi:hypothetical protein
LHEIKKAVDFATITQLCLSEAQLSDFDRRYAEPSCLPTACFGVEPKNMYWLAGISEKLNHTAQPDWIAGFPAISTIAYARLQRAYCALAHEGA